MATRLSLPVILSLVITLALFYVMQYLIAGGKSIVSEDDIGDSGKGRTATIGLIIQTDLSTAMDQGS